jgi:hypothetical protein
MDARQAEAAASAQNGLLSGASLGSEERPQRTSAEG